MCESKPRCAALRGAVAAVGGVLLAGWVLRVVAAAGSVAAAVVAVEGAAAVVGAVVLVRLLWPPRRPVRSHYGERVMSRAALTAPPLELEAPAPVRESVINSKEAVR